MSADGSPFSKNNFLGYKTTAELSSLPVEVLKRGVWCWNTTTKRPEIYNGSVWEGFGSGAVSQLVYRPGIAPSAEGVFDNWADLYIAFLSTAGVVEIVIDDRNVFPAPAVIPAGTYNLDNRGILRGFPIARPATQNSMVAECANGVVIQNCGGVTNNLILTTVSAAPVFTLGNSEVLPIYRGAQVLGSVAAPIIEIAPGGVFAIIFLGDFGAIPANGGITALNIGAGSGAQILMGQGAVVGQDTITGDATTIAAEVVGGTSATYGTQIGFLGTFLRFLFTDAINMGCPTLNAGNWVFPPPANVNEALDRIAAAIVAGAIGGPIP